MKYTIRSEKVDITDSIREYATQKISKMEKYFDNSEDVNVKIVFSIRGREHKVEVTINNSTFDLRAEVSHSDMYAAIDLVLDKLETQIRKYKSKLISKGKSHLVYDDSYIDEDEIESVVRRKKIYLKPMDEEEAALQMELLGHTFYIYKDAETEKVNVLYKRYDGSYGVIETN